MIRVYRKLDVIRFIRGLRLISTSSTGTESLIAKRFETFNLVACKSKPMRSISKIYDFEKSRHVGFSGLYLLRTLSSRAYSKDSF